MRRCKKIDIFPFLLFCPLFLHRLMSCGPLDFVSVSSAFRAENSEPQRASCSEVTAEAITSCARHPLLSQFSAQPVSGRALRAPAHCPGRWHREYVFRVHRARAGRRKRRSRTSALEARSPTCRCRGVFAPGAFEEGNACRWFSHCSQVVQSLCPGQIADRTRRCRGVAP